MAKEKIIVKSTFHDWAWLVALCSLRLNNEDFFVVQKNLLAWNFGPAKSSYNSLMTLFTVCADKWKGKSAPRT